MEKENFKDIDRHKVAFPAGIFSMDIEITWISICINFFDVSSSLSNPADESRLKVGRPQRNHHFDPVCDSACPR